MKIRGNTITVQQISLLIKGGIMKGALDMGSHILKGIPAPEEEDHAVNKQYADRIKSQAVNEAKTNTDNALKEAKKYSDDKHQEFTVNLTADGWSGDTAPYTQTINVEGILASDNPHYLAVYSGDLDAKLIQKESFTMVDDLDTADNSVTFTCLEDKPEVDLEIQMEVNR